jgi:hypothetical protein
MKIARRAALLFAGSMAIAIVVPAAAVAGVPSNDAFEDARRVSLAEMPFTRTIDPTGASTQPNEPLANECGGIGEEEPTVWFKVRLSQTRTLRASASSTEDTRLGVWRGDDLASLVDVGCSDGVNDADQDGSRVAFRARADRWYYIQLVGDTTPAPITFELRVVTPPAHDDFADALTIGSLPFEHTFKNVNATVQSGEPTAFGDCASVGATAWYRIVPQTSGTLRADTIESGAFDTFVNVYRGSSLAGLTAVGCSDDFRDATDHSHARAAFRVQAGQTYYLQVGGYEGESGPITLRVRRVTSPSNDSFTDAPLITAHAFDLDSSTANATVQTGEPLRLDHPGGCDGRLIGHTVWFRLAPAGDPPNINLKTFGSDFDTILAVYTGGPSLGGLDPFACSDDANDTSQSSVTFDPVAGVTYYVQVGGYYFDSGNLSFAVTVK